MGKTSIEWTDFSFNAWRGCTKVHEGCAHCYAEVAYVNRVKGVKWGPNGTRQVASAGMWSEPLRWNRRAIEEGIRFRVFAQSLSDTFEDWPHVAPDGVPPRAMHDHKGRVLWTADSGPGWPWFSDDEIEGDGSLRYLHMDDVRRRLFTVIDATPSLDWLLLTKRPERIAECWPQRETFSTAEMPWAHRKNIWLGTSISLQEHADKQIPELSRMGMRCAGLFLSIEPLLGPVDISRWLFPAANRRTSEQINWVIVGGESGPKARPCHPHWVRDLRDQCLAAGIPYFFKQWGTWRPVRSIHEIPESTRINIEGLEIPGHATNRYSPDDECLVRGDKSGNGAELDGREWKQTPFSTETR